MDRRDLPPTLPREWAGIPIEQLADGIERQMIWGERLMVCRLRFAPRVVTAVHCHPHEQIPLVEEGRALFTIGDEQGIASAGTCCTSPPTSATARRCSTVRWC